MDLDLDKENKYMEKLFFSVRARAKQVASTAFNGATALCENVRLHLSDRNQCSIIELRKNARSLSQMARQSETQPRRL